MKWKTSGQFVIAIIALGFGLASVTPGCMGDVFIGCEETATCFADHESCLDGYDNNGNGLADCADPECSPDYECADFALPEGDWKLATVRKFDLSSAEGDSCPDGSDPTVYYVEPSALACAPCSCTINGGACSAPQIECYDGAKCEGKPKLTEKSTSTNCISDPDVKVDGNNLGSCKITAPGIVTTEPSDCAVEGGGLLNPPSWGGELHVCVLGTGSSSCTSGGVCMARFDEAPKLCIIGLGSAECPEGWRAEKEKIEAYEGGDDTRACTACGCNFEAAQCTDGGYTVFDRDGCNGGGIGYEAPTFIAQENACIDVSLYLDGSGNGTGSFLPKHGILTLGPGVCTGGEPSGKVTTHGPHTICCR